MFTRIKLRFMNYLRVLLRSTERNVHSKFRLYEVPINQPILPLLIIFSYFSSINGTEKEKENRIKVFHLPNNFPLMQSTTHHSQYINNPLMYSDL